MDQRKIWRKAAGEKKASVNHSIPATWMELEQTVGQDPDVTDAQSDGFRYDYDDNI